MVAGQAKNPQWISFLEVYAFAQILKSFLSEMDVVEFSYRHWFIALEKLFDWV